MNFFYIHPVKSLAFTLQDYRQNHPRRACPDFIGRININSPGRNPGNMTPHIQTQPQKG